MNTFSYQDINNFHQPGWRTMPQRDDIIDSFRSATVRICILQNSSYITAVPKKAFQSLGKIGCCNLIERLIEALN